jgi:hypothetical protein
MPDMTAVFVESIDASNQYGYVSKMVWFLKVRRLMEGGRHRKPKIALPSRQYNRLSRLSRALKQ